MKTSLSFPLDMPDIEGQIEQMARDAAQQVMQPELAQMATPSQANDIVAPNAPEIALPEDEATQALARTLYGSDFPLLLSGQEDDSRAWASWVRGRWVAHRGAVERHLHLVERNRLFRIGQQWVSSRGRGPWREPLKPVDSARVVYNMVDKALDQRLQIMTDQRPGFKVEPTTVDPDEKRKAEARQIALEYQYDTQNMDGIRRTAGFWAQTDGVSFLHSYWDAEKGPWDSRMADGNMPSKPLGDLATKVLRVEQVRISANATSTDSPYYVITREVLSATEAAWRYGVSGALASHNSDAITGTSDLATDAGMNRWVLDQTTIGEGDRLRMQETVERFTIYVDRHPDLLPNGLQIVIVGDTMVSGPLPLLFGVIPVVPFRDGSADPSYFPRPVMEQWLDHQVRINALLSKWVDSVRVNAAGRFLTRAGTLVTETIVGGGTSLMEVNSGRALNDIMQPVPGFSVGTDCKELLQLEKKAFEDASGYNDTSRGQISGDASGRAILAAREQLERVFAPGVAAAAAALTAWAKVQVAGMAFGYDVPRDLGAVGNSRPDLAHALTRDMFDGPVSVRVDPETLMPMPRVYRQFLLDSWLDKGVITQQQYLRRQSTAMISDMETPDEDQSARAKRICEAIRLRQPNVPEMRWQDNESIHQDVLEREIILRDDLGPDIIVAAQNRWAQLSQQASMKSGGPPPQGAPPTEPNGNGGPSPFQPSPQTQPLATASPAIGGAPPQMIPTGVGQTPNMG
jgi:hypothetical protein